MNTRKFFLSLLLLVTATFMSGVLAQSAEDAAKYGQLQEIQIPAAGKLGKYIKKKDPNVTALKISGELNEKDLAILFSLPNIAYLDLSDAQNIATTYEFKGKDGKQEFKIDEDEFMLLCGNSLKYLATPKNKSVISILPEVAYEFDCLVLNDKIRFINCGKERTERYSNYRLCHNSWEEAKNIKVKSVKIHSLNEGSNNKMLSQYISDFFSNGQALREILSNDISLLTGGGIFCETMYIAGNGNSLSKEAKRALLSVKPQDIIIESTGEKFLKSYYGDAKVVDLSSYDAIIAGAFEDTHVEEVNVGNKITVIPESCFKGCENLKKITMPNVTMVMRGAFESTNIISSLHLKYKLPAESLSLNLNELRGTGITTVDLTEFTYAPELIYPTDNNKYTDRDYLRYIQNNMEFIIPAGARSHRYNVGEWTNLRIKEFGVPDAYSFQLDSVGSLKNFITDENALNISKLTLKGVMDETEFGLIQKCKYLKHLDMTNCFTFASVEVAKSEAAANLFLMQLMSLGSTMDKEKKEQQYAHYETTYDEMQKAQIRDNFIKSLGVDDIKMEDLDAVFGHGKVIISDECYFPEGSFEGLTELEEIHFPNKLLRLERKHLYYLRGASERYKTYIQHLKKVRVSNELHTLGDYLFANSQLEDINIPDSLQHVGYFCFKNCKLKTVDLSNTNISTYHFYTTNQYPDWETYIGETKSIGLPLYVFLGNPLEELRLPKKLTKAEWIGDKLSDNNTAKSNEIVMYVYFKEPFCKVGQFEEAYGKIKELHIPRGMKAAWRGYPNLIDDIDL